ncbi:MAG: hypothetical protein ACOX12_00750 [Eggerthellaceae bacterium]|jgi:hypothetical protein
MDERIALRMGTAASLLCTFLLAAVLAVCLGSGMAFAASGSSASSTSAHQSSTYAQIPGDTAGTAFSQDSSLSNSYASGDLYWGSQNLSATNVRVGNDLMSIASVMYLTNVEVDGDARLAARAITLDSVNMHGNGTFACDSLSIGKGSTASGLYCGANSLSFEGTAKYLVAYGNKIYFNGTVNGDVVLSAQEIEIGPDAKVTGTLQVRSGQDLDIPSTASIANVNNTLDNPNAIDQVSQIRSAIAPYFQMGSILLVVVSFILLALLLLWLGGRQMDESARVVRAHPFGMFMMGLLGVVVIAAAAAVCFALIFTIPVGFVLLLMLVIALLMCIPFTGAALALQAKRFPRAVRAMIGAGVAAALMFVPYVRVVVLVIYLSYFVGYVLRILFMGHDDEFNRQIRQRRGKSQPAHADGGEHGDAEHPAPATPEIPEAQNTPEATETAENRSEAADNGADAAGTDAESASDQGTKPSSAKE